jgi:hypothetical protein
MTPIIAAVSAEELAMRIAAKDSGLQATRITTAAPSTSLRPVKRAYTSPAANPATQHARTNTDHQAKNEDSMPNAPSGASRIAKGGG